ncbi:MAG: WYL domain-containing protein, partial [Phocaeicola sp.]
MARKSSKESTARLFHRYVWLVDIIFRAGRVTFEEINNRWVNSSLNSTGEDFPLKTFHNHKIAISEMFDIDIECDKRNGYTYYIDNSDDMEHEGVRSWLMNTFTVNNLINESHKLKHRILFEQIPSGQQFLAPIIEARRDSMTVEVTYQNYWHDKSYVFEVKPYCIKVFRQRW